MAFTLKINGTPHKVDVDGDTPLLWVPRRARHDRDMTGTKFGCGQVLCGAFTEHVDDAATRSCITTVDSIGESAITTIEAIRRRHSARADNRLEVFLLRRMSPLLCRFSDAGDDDLATRSGSRRPKSAKARNRGRYARSAVPQAQLWGFKR
jgi:aerobic-type carbon monoxide dehydrogenase small subunit (CoxS/CutS family)